MRHAAVGEYDPRFWSYPPDSNALLQTWVSSEVWADSRLEAAMNIDRRTLRITDSAYVELQEMYHERLRVFLGTVRERLYAEPAAERRAESVREEARRISRLIASTEVSLSPKTRREISSAWRRASRSGADSAGRLARKISVSELYELVTEVAKEVLSPSDANRFLVALTRRLRE